MKILNNITIEITQEDLKEIISDYISKQGYKTENITFSYGSRFEGYGMTEREVPYFDGCTVKAKKEGN